MPRPSYDRLLQENSSLKVELGRLSTDDEWNVITRKALPIRMKQAAESARYVVVVAILNPGEVTPADIGRALNFRAANVLVRARWSNNEALFVLSDDPHGFVKTMTPILKNAGVKAMIAYTMYSGNVSHDHDRAASELTDIFVR